MAMVNARGMEQGNSSLLVQRLQILIDPNIRKGNGKCTCDKGYKNESCNECDNEYYESFRDETKLLCSQCHHACDAGGCNTAGPKGCRVCKRGWSMQPELGGCVDIDECVTIENTCTTNQFCVNSEGSHSCLGTLDT